MSQKTDHKDNPWPSMREEAEHWWSEERHKAEIAEAYRMGWENAKEECAKVVEVPAKGQWNVELKHALERTAAAIRALKEK